MPGEVDDKTLIVIKALDFPSSRTLLHGESKAPK